MWSETIGYRDYRPQYLRRFFREVARRIPLRGDEHLLDLGCGAGEVALGFRPYVARLTGVDAEAPMLEEAGKRATMAGCAMRLIHALAQDAPEDLGQFHLITMGKAHWFMHSPRTLARIDRWLLPKGHILICLPLDENLGGAAWRERYDTIRRRWARGNHRELMRLTADQFFQGTNFEPVAEVSVRGTQRVDLDHLLKRAIGYPSTSRAILGEADADRMLAEIRVEIAPYFRDGSLLEQQCTAGLLYRRKQAP